MAGLAGMTLTGCAGSETREAANGPRALRGTTVAQATGPRVRGLDGVIDISHLNTVTDFTLIRQNSHIHGILHKASEGGDWVDDAYTMRRPQAEAAGILWGAYHFGTHQYSGEDQARNFLAAAQPGPRTLVALDFEPNERHPKNSMDLAQAEAFVRVVYRETGRLPLVYTHPNWANGVAYGRAGTFLRRCVDENSVLAQCDLWLADYRESPEIPNAWARRGWRFWQYAGNETQDDDAYGSASRAVVGVDRCDRNLFAGDVAALHRYWGGRTVTS
ncbi:MAG TPA: glycoside hydrolase family 25 protein [Alphaproteobacteria bacterium]|nr:glycoside hydrolase family 25 protein [Alphaproteobacteria bacterium]